MTNTRAEAAYLRSLAAFRIPTLDLLHRRYAPFVVAALSVVFTVDRPAVAVADAHAEIAEILDELRAAGYDEDDRALPSGTAREICRHWVRVGWLVPQIEGDVEQRLEEAENVLHLARELPADFARVAESIKAMQRDVVADLRRDIRPTGEVLREYLERGQHVMQSTPEGRAFAGALRLIGDPEHIDRLTTQLRTLLAQPFSRLMGPGQRSDLDS